MSLLMKALEKAAKDRGETRSEPAVAAPAAAAAPAKSELALEPMAAGAPPPASQPSSRADAAPRSATMPPRAAPSTAAAREQAQAVMQAQAAIRPDSGGVGAYLRTHPIMLFGLLAGLVAVAFAIYVYLQIFHPGFFSGRPAPALKGPQPPLVQAPPAVAPALPSGPLLKEAVAESAAAPAPAAPVAPRAVPQAAAAPAAAEDVGPRNTISVSRGSAEPVLNPQLAQAYAALQSGQVDEARRLYSQLANADPRNVDALLGLAAIAAQQGNVEEASRRYLQILELDPRHALAQGGLIALLGRADPLAAESRLRQLIAREPSAHLHFTLGNLYAEQSQWAPAQQAYFQAHHLEPANPDYAYNLAVALEHVSQPKLALGFYRRAVQLASARGRVHFNLPQAQERVVRLAQQVE